MADERRKTIRIPIIIPSPQRWPAQGERRKIIAVSDVDQIGARSINQAITRPSSVVEKRILFEKIVFGPSKDSLVALPFILKRIIEIIETRTPKVKTSLRSDQELGFEIGKYCEVKNHTTGIQSGEVLKK